MVVLFLSSNSDFLARQAYINQLVMQTGIGGQLRSVVSLIDRLRDIQLEQYIKLPKIVVVGSQSSGKSSLIEQIVGLDFLPRGTGVVTRRPLQIRMTYDPNTPKPIASFEEIPGKSFKDFGLVRMAIEQLTDKVCGTTKDIVDRAIILKVQSCSSPNLTVIDLPGLTRIPVPGQSADIYKVTSDMIVKYMSDPSSIILCVVPANQDITNDEVLYEARQIDRLGERTLACITKIDIMDRGTDARALLLNKQVPLKLGYVGIKNRSQEDIKNGMSVADSLNNEKMFFSKSPIYSSLPPSALGTSALVNSLTKVLSSNISQFLPELMEQVKQRKNALHQIIKQYGKPLPKNQTQEQALLWEISSHFLNELKKCLKGHLTDLKAKQEISKISTHLTTTLQSTLEDQFNNTPQEMTSQKVLFAIIKFEGGSLPGFPSIHSFYYLIDPLIRRLRLPLLHIASQICQTVNRLADTILSQVCKEFEGFRGHLLQQVNRLIEQAKRKSSTFIEQLIECETNYIYTNNSQFYEIMEKPSKQKHEDDPIVKKTPMVAVLKKRVLAYYKVMIKNLRQIVPRNVKRIVLQLAPKEIEFEIFQASHCESNKRKQWLKPNDLNFQQRLYKEKQYDVLLKAQQFLLTHPAFSKLRVQDIKKKREQREIEIKELQEKKVKQKPKINDQSPIRVEQKADLPKDSARKANNQDLNKQDPSNNNQSKSKQGIFQNFFGTKRQEPKISQKPTEKKEVKQTAEQRAGFFDNLFGQKKDEPKPPVFKEESLPPKSSFKDEYNRQAGYAADKAVEETFKNETFQKQSRKAVENGTSVAAQKQFGVSQKTGNMMGKGTAWLFGQEATQNLLKDQAKTNLKDQIQKK